jgi:hypothetical protein
MDAPIVRSQYPGAESFCMPMRTQTEPLDRMARPATQTVAQVTFEKSRGAESPNFLPPRPQMSPSRVRARSSLVVAKLAGLSIALAAVAAIVWHHGTIDRPTDSSALPPTAPSASPSRASVAVETRPALPPRLIVQPLITRPFSGQPAPLGLAVQEPPQDAVVTITGLVPGMTLSAGRPVGTDAWEVPASNVGDTWVGPPVNFVGVSDLAAELRLPDGTVADRQAMRFEWVPSASIEPTSSVPPPPQLAPKETSLSPKETVEAQSASSRASDLPDPEQIKFLVIRGKELIAQGDIVGARLLLQRAADANDVDAALALAVSYDSIALRELKVYGVPGDGDAALARVWYHKAEELGSSEAPRRLEMLAAGTR